jgi:manganese/zinc/iron transport system substrate-binding protein
MKRLLFILLIALLLFSCSDKDSPLESDQKKKIVVTTNIIFDAVEYIAGEKNDVVALMGEGVDPHLYKASQNDVEQLISADMIVYNGLHLEGKMIEILEKLKRSKEVFALGEGVPDDEIIESDDMNTPDPHIWFDALLWADAIAYFSEELMDWDTVNAAYYEARTEAYINKLVEADAYAKEKINAIDAEQRVLITAHDAFHYFGRAYSIEVYGLQGISTLSEYGIKDVSNLVNFIIERKIKSVFIESSVSEKALKSVVEGCGKKGHDVKIGGMLYSDAMGARSGPEGTYNGMFVYNVNTIYQGLK